jgi:hypothetical protein
MGFARPRSERRARRGICAILGAIWLDHIDGPFMIRSSSPEGVDTNGKIAAILRENGASLILPHSIVKADIYSCVYRGASGIWISLLKT